MAGAGRRRLEALSFKKNLFRIVSLLFLVHVGLALDFEDNLQNMLIKSIQRTRESVRLLRESESGAEHILTLLDITNSVANKKQLKLFQEYLQEAVDEANQQKVEKAAAAKAYTYLFNIEIFNYLPKIQTWKRGDPLTRRIAEALEQIFQVSGHYLSLHKDLYTSTANETETNLENALHEVLGRRFMIMFEL